MLRIHEHQMARLRQSSRRDFVGRMVDYLRDAHASDVAAMPGPALEAWVSDGIDKAKGYGVTMEPEVAQLLLLLLVLGAEADTDEARPWIREALTDENLVGIGKVRKLIHFARKHRVEGVEKVAVVREVTQP